MNVVGFQRDSEKSAANRNVAELVKRLDGSFVRRESSCPVSADLVIQWGFKQTVGLMSAIAFGIPYVIIDLGYWGNRYKNFSVSFNGFHGTSARDDLVSGRSPRARPRVQDWRSGKGENVLVVGQMPNDQSLRGQDIDAWMGRTAPAAAQAFGKPVIKRPHPKMLNPWEPSLPPIADALKDAYCCVTWTSTAALDAVVAGVPTVAMHKGNIAYPVCAHDFTLRTPDGREEWLHELSWRQWDFTSPAELDRLAEYIKSIYPQLRDKPLDSPRNLL